MKVRKILRYSPIEGKLRLLQLVWSKGVVGDGRGSSSKLTLSLRKKIYMKKVERYKKEIVILGFSVSYCISYGGVFV